MMPKIQKLIFMADDLAWKFLDFTGLGNNAMNFLPFVSFVVKPLQYSRNSAKIYSLSQMSITNAGD
jgi:hypothetical protein